MSLPVRSKPSLGQLGVLADIATGQALMSDIPTGQGIRTSGLHLSLSGKLEPGMLLRGWGERVSFDGSNGLSRGIICAPDGTICSVATGRFMVVEDNLAPSKSAPTEPLEGLESLEWDSVLGIRTHQKSPGRSVMVATPLEDARNSAPIMHGGIHVRALELSMRGAAEFMDQGGGYELADMNVSFHRPIPIDGHTPILLLGSVLRRGRRVVIISSSLETEDGRLLTSGQGTFLVND